MFIEMTEHTRRREAGISFQQRGQEDRTSPLDRLWYTKETQDRSQQGNTVKKGKGSPYSVTERRVPELIPVLGSQPAGDVSHKPGGRLPLFSARPAVNPATLKRAATNFAAW